MELYIFKPLAKYVPENYQSEFLDSIIDKNFQRTLFVSKFAPIILLINSIPDIYNILFSKGNASYNYLGLCIGISLFLSVIIWRLSYKSSSKNINSSQKLNLTKALFFPIAIILATYSCVINTEMHDISSFYIVLFANIMFFYLPGFSQIIFNFIAFFIIVSICIFSDSDYVRANNNSQILSIAFALGITYWRLHRNFLANEFMNRKYYEEEKDKVEKLNIELIEKNQSLEELNKEKGEFLGIAAHDLKNPLMTIKMASEMICGEFRKDKTNIIYELGNDINKVSETMFELINNYLDVNRIDSVGLKVNPIGLCLYDLLQNSEVKFYDRLKSKNIKIEFINFESPIMIYSDIFLLKQVFDNIVSNAIKYSDLNKTVQIKLNKNSDKFINISIKDFGQGISEEEQKKLFGKFIRLSSIPTAGEHSTGLGLYIVKKLVDRLGGKIWCESELGKGAEFFVELPKRISLKYNIN